MSWLCWDAGYQLSCQNHPLLLEENIANARIVSSAQTAGLCGASAHSPT